ncbi:MAG: hypothetical protein U0U67_08550 [Chitinophagales bacterium]
MSKIIRQERKHLSAIAEKVHQRKPLTPTDVEDILAFQFNDKEHSTFKLLSTVALPLALLLGYSMAAWPTFFENLVKHFPSWTNLSDNQLLGVDYLWNILAYKVNKVNFIYHIPNIVLHSFGILGVKKLTDYIRSKSWLDKVLDAQKTVELNAQNGTQQYELKQGHSILFVGNGDFVAHHYDAVTSNDETLTIAASKPIYTNVWIKYEIGSPFATFKDILQLANAGNCGEIVFFPVTDQHLFLPGENDYDISADRLEVIITAIRDIERINNWKESKVILVGDRNQKNTLQTETKASVLDDTMEVVSLQSIQQKFSNVFVVDPTDITCLELLKKFPDKQFLFRSSLNGSQTYKDRFYQRMEDVGYKETDNAAQKVTVGYDLLEEQIQRETYHTALNNYFPVVLSKGVLDAIKRQNLPASNFIYVPDLVINKLKELTKDA